MSVESEILRIQHNIASSYAAVSSKGGEVPLQPTSANLAAAVSSIPQTLPPPDNNPIGTIISFMGTAAPKDYLVCDGAQYNISDYPELAAFFQTQFGTKNHFGGDGTTTFAVPDMRNLFLRGYRGEAEEQLSGEIGEKQDGTEHLNIVGSTTPDINFQRGVVTIKNYDEILEHSRSRSTTGKGNNYTISTPLGGELEYYGHYTSRPVNMAVLYCIKAVESVPAEEVYSTEETRIGTWIDGKPLYRKTYIIPETTLISVTDFIFIDSGFHWTIKRGYGNVTVKDWTTDYIVPCAMSDIALSVGHTTNTGALWLNYKISGKVTLGGEITVEYTKPTD